MNFDDMFLNNKIYDGLLAKFAGNTEVLELIKYCILDWEETKEAHFRKFGAYPNDRNLIMKLKFDLVNKKNEITREVNNG